MNPWLIMLLVIGPFVVFAAWLLIDSGRSRTVEQIASEPNALRLRMQQRLTDLVGALLLLAYCVALIAGWLKPRSTAEAMIIAVAMIGYVFFSTRRSIQESAAPDEASEIRQLRQALLMLITFGIILGVAGWMGATRTIR